MQVIAKYLKQFSKTFKGDVFVYFVFLSEFLDQTAQNLFAHLSPRLKLSLDPTISEFLKTELQPLTQEMGSYGVLHPRRIRSSEPGGGDHCG
jgi:hypothetical protein